MHFEKLNHIMRKIGVVLFFVINGLMLCWLAWNLADAMMSKKKVYGYIQQVRVLPEKVLLTAKMDTGASLASLGVSQMKTMKIEGKTWISFLVHTKKGPILFKKKLYKYARIKLRASEQGVHAKKYVIRPVVLMRIRLGSEEHIIRVNLADRKNFVYVLLLGREAITRFNGFIDPRKKLTKITKKS